MGSGRADLDRRLHEEIGARGRRCHRGRLEPTRVSPDLDPDHQNRPHPIGMPSSTPRDLRRRSAPSREEGQQPDLAPPAAKAATRGPRPPEIRRPPDQIAGTTPTPLPAAGDREPRQGPRPDPRPSDADRSGADPAAAVPDRAPGMARRQPRAAARRDGERGRLRRREGNHPPRRPLGAARGRGAGAPAL